jgi:hypothetical protein
VRPYYIIIVAMRPCTNHVARGLGFSMLEGVVDSMSEKHEWIKGVQDPVWNCFVKADVAHEGPVVGKKRHMGLGTVVGKPLVAVEMDAAVHVVAAFEMGEKKVVASTSQ